MRTCILTVLNTLLFVATVAAQYNILDSGGKLPPEQAAYNVHHYDLDLSIDPADSSIYGRVITHAQIVHPLEHFVLDLDTVFAVHAVNYIEGGQHPVLLKYEIRNGQIWADLPTTRQPGDEVAIEVEYSGKPRVAVDPPWEGGFTWAETLDGQPWIGVTSQLYGANIWWPVKDHPSDRADSILFNVTIPDSLIAAASGRLREVVNHDNGLSTYKWFVSTPINNYALSVNIAPYEVIERSYTSITGDGFPIIFWVLPENYEKAEKLFEQIIQHMNFFEEYLGPYPFRADKYGVAESPYLGMEHQTIIAYGAGYQNDVVYNTGSGFDDLHHHELGHEWWGNMVSSYDWRDFWLHEGFCTYMQPLYAEYLHGEEQYQKFMNALRVRIANNHPVSPRETMSSREMDEDQDVYMKGAWFLHTLRYLIGDNHFFEALRLMAYPDPEHEAVSDGSNSRFAATDDFLTIAEEVSNQKLDWLFEVYLRQETLPELIQQRKGDKVKLSWQVNDDLYFPMPLEIKINGNTKRIHIPPEGVILNLDEGDTLDVDPNHWVLRKF